MLVNCVVGEDSCESLGLQGDPTSPSWRESVLNIHWKDWCWSWNSNILANTLAKNWLIGKEPDAGKDWRQEEKGTTEDEMVGWHHWFNGHEFEQAPGVGDGPGSLACCSPWGGRVRPDWTEVKKWAQSHASPFTPGLPPGHTPQHWMLLTCCPFSSGFCVLGGGTLGVLSFPASSVGLSQLKCVCVWGVPHHILSSLLGHATGPWWAEMGKLHGESLQTEVPGSCLGRQTRISRDRSLP